MQVRPMRVSLWIIQGLAIVFLIKSLLLGLGVLHTADHVGDHVRSAFLALLFCLGSHVGTVFYIIGTKKILRTTREDLGFEAPQALVRRNHNIIRRTLPLVTVGSLVFMVAFILGGAADTGLVTFAVHGGIAITAAVLNIFVLIWEIFMTQRNHHVLLGLRIKEMEMAPTIPSSGA